MRKSPSKGPLRHIFQENFDQSHSRRPVKATSAVRPETGASQRVQILPIRAETRQDRAKSRACYADFEGTEQKSALRGQARTSQSASPLRMMNEHSSDDQDVDLSTFRRLTNDCKPEDRPHLRVHYDVAPVNSGSEVTPSFRGNSQRSEDGAQAEVPRLRDMYRKILREHQSLKAKVENQQMWIRKLVSQSEAQRHPEGRIPLLSKVSGLKAQYKSQRRALSSAADIPLTSLPPFPKHQELNQSQEDSETIRFTMPTSSTPSPKADLRGDSLFIYPSSKGRYDHPLSKPFLTEDRRRGTSVPKQRQDSGHKFPKEVFPMNIRRRAVIR